MRVNMDETSIVLNNDGQKGVVSKGLAKDVVLIKKKSRKRGSLTLVALVCDDTSVQPLLPQLIIGNEHVLRVLDLKELEPILPQNVVLVRAKSSWITIEILIVIIEMIRSRLNQHNIAKTPLLLMDACPVHLNAQVWKAAKRSRIYICFVPACLTWLLQPLDVRVLSKLKAFVRSQYRKYQLQQQEAYVSVVGMVKIWVEGIRKILQGTAWSAVFDECGYALNTSSVMTQIRNIFSKAASTDFETPLEQPTQEQLLRILPRKRKYEFNALLWEIPVESTSTRHGKNKHTRHDVTQSVEAGGIPTSSSSAFRSRSFRIEALEDAPDPIAMRTRSHSRLLGDSQASQEDLVPSASQSAAPCQSSMLRPELPATSRTPVRPRLRARAVPPANKAAFRWTQREQQTGA